jgi:serine/threonine-protein kinase HipA
VAQISLFSSRSKKVSHILPFASLGKNDEKIREYNEKRKRISISGIRKNTVCDFRKTICFFVDEIMQGTLKATALVERSFLSSKAKKKYIAILEGRHSSLGLK